MLKVKGKNKEEKYMRNYNLLIYLTIWCIYIFPKYYWKKILVLLLNNILEVFFKFLLLKFKFLLHFYLDPQSPCYKSWRSEGLFSRHPAKHCIFYFYFSLLSIKLINAEDESGQFIIMLDNIASVITICIFVFGYVTGLQCET